MFTTDWLEGFDDPIRSISFDSDLTDKKVKLFSILDKICFD